MIGLLGFHYSGKGYNYMASKAGSFASHIHIYFGTGDIKSGVSMKLFTYNQ